VVGFLESHLDKLLECKLYGQGFRESEGLLFTPFGPTIQTCPNLPFHGI
jgi:hypothetical protein